MQLHVFNEFFASNTHHYDIRNGIQQQESFQNVSLESSAF